MEPLILYLAGGVVAIAYAQMAYFVHQARKYARSAAACVKSAREASADAKLARVGAEAAARRAADTVPDVIPFPAHRIAARQVDGDPTLGLWPACPVADFAQDMICDRE